MATLPLQAIVRYPQQAQAGVSYLMTVDLEFDPQRPQAWTLRREEIAIECQVSSTLFTISPPEDPTLILHRYGGTYGSLSFLLKAQERIGTGSIHLTLFDNGLPIGDFALATQVNTRSNVPGTPVVFVETVEQPTAPPETGAYDREITYDNFDLMITRAPEGYDVNVLSSPVGEARNTFILPFTNEEISAFLESSGGQRYPRASQADNQPLTPQLFGTRLYEAVFAGEVGMSFRRSLDAALQQNRGLRVRLHLRDTPELATLPWEYLYVPDSNRFLALSDQNLLVRYLPQPQAQRPLAPTVPLSVSAPTPLSILVLIAQPTDLSPLDVAREWEQLRAALSDLENGGVLTLERLAPATLEGLQHRLRQNDVHILHFIGHGFFYDERTQSGLIFENETGYSHQVITEQLSVLLQGHSPLQLAFLHIDYGTQRDRLQPALGVAQTLVQRGLPAAVTLQSAVSDRFAMTLAREFYRALAAGYPVDLAISEARRALYVENEQWEWGAPVLYMSSPDGILWQMSGETEDAQFNGFSSESQNTKSAQGGRNIITIIGIDDYAHLPKLRNAVSDAQGVRSLFIEHLGFQELMPPLYNKEATLDAMRALVMDGLPTRLEPNDSLVLFFAGHGQTISRSVNTRQMQSSYLIPVDGESTVSSNLSLDAFLQDVANLPARHILVILDTCYSGFALGDTVQILRRPERYSEDLSKRISRHVITSAMADQPVLDNGPVTGHSLFTGMLVEALELGKADEDTKGFVTSSELALYVQRRVATWSDSKQTPDFGTFALDDRGEMIIFLKIGQRQRTI